MKNRCVIQLSEASNQDYVDVYVSPRICPTISFPRIYGSHSEAKKQLPKWLAKWPNAKIVDAGEAP